jgi:metallophosphoesterase superfamily enzyme
MPYHEQAFVDTFLALVCGYGDKYGLVVVGEHDREIIDDFKKSAVLVVDDVRMIFSLVYNFHGGFLISDSNVEQSTPSTMGIL